MRHILLATFLLLSVNILAQTSPCVPLASNQDSLFGLWPDTIQNLPYASAGVYYETAVQLKTPTIVSEVPGAPADVSGIPIGNLPIDSIALIQANGLPAGLTMNCDDPSCSYPGNSIGCVNLFGTTNAIGVHDLEFVVDGWVNISLLGTLSMSDATQDYIYITGYKVVVNSSSDISLIEANKFSVLQNIPNPFLRETRITYNVLQPQLVSLSIYNIMGELVLSEHHNADHGVNELNLSLENLESGIYFYALSNGEETITKRMIIASR